MSSAGELSTSVGDSEPAVPANPAPPISTRDEHALFMLSFVPVLKRLPEDRRSLAKIRLAQLMHDVEFPRT